MEGIYLCQPRQINKSKTQYVWGVYLEVDRLSIDALIIAGYACCFVLDFSLYILKVFDAWSENPTFSG